MSWMARCDELGDRREPVELGNSVGSDVDAALTFKAVHGRVVMTHSTVRAREREARCAHRTPPRESLARKPIRGKTFTREFHGHRDFPASPWCACDRDHSLVGHPSRLRRLDITFQARQTVHSECGAEADEFGYPIPKRDNCLLGANLTLLGL